MSGSRWSRSPGVILGSLTTLNALNYLDRYVAAATLPLILADLAISDAQGGLLQSLFIVAYSLACGPAGWLGDVGKRLRLVAGRSEEHTSELQSRGHLVCRLLLEKKKQNIRQHVHREGKEH